MLKAVLFDLDGTLIETEEFQYNAWVDVLKPYGISLDVSEYISSFCGRSGLAIDEEIIKKFNLQTPKGSLISVKERVVMGMLKSHPLKLADNAKDTIEFLRKKVPLAVISSAPRKEVLFKLEKSGLMDKFKVVLGRDDVQKPKPDPEPYLLGLRRLGVYPENAFACEDTYTGVESAKAAGLFCIAIPNKFSKGQDFSKADKVVESLKDVIGIAKRIYGLKGN